MFDSNRNLVGLDMGSSTIKLVELGKESGKIKLLSAGIVDNPVLELKDKNTPEAEEKLAESINEACKKFDIKGKSVAIALGTTEVIFDYLRFPVLNEKELAHAVRLEAEQRISSDINEVSIDYMRSGIKDKDGQENILLIAVSKEIAQKKVAVVEKAGLNPLIMDVEPLALLNCLLPLSDEPLKENESIGILNIGANLTNLSILATGTVPTVRNINFGSDKFTSFISKETKLSWKEAEQLKKNTEKLKQKISIPDMLEKLTFSFINELKSSIEYTHKRSGESEECKHNRITDPRIKKIFLTGGGCFILGIDNFLSKNLGMEIVRWNPFEKVQFSRSVDDSLKSMGYLFPIAIGLGMRTV